MNDVMQGRWTLLHVIGLVVWQKHVKSLSLSLHPSRSIKVNEYLSCSACLDNDPFTNKAREYSHVQSSAECGDNQREHAMFVESVTSSPCVPDPLSLQRCWVT